MPYTTDPTPPVSPGFSADKCAMIKSIEGLMEAYFQKTWPLMQKVAIIRPDAEIPPEDIQELLDLRQETLPFLLKIASFNADKAAWDDPEKLREIESALRYCINLWDTRGLMLLQKRQLREKRRNCLAAFLFLVIVLFTFLVGKHLIGWIFLKGSLSGFPLL